jgi:hypothetical protein
MFSFLDNSLYGDAAPQASQASQASQMKVPAQPRPVPEEARASEGRAHASQVRQTPAPCLRGEDLNAAMDHLQARIASAEKRTVLMEQRLLHALDEKRPAAQTGCSWWALALAVLISLSVSFLIRIGRVEPSFPVVHPCSPMVLSGALASAPGTFLRSV